MQPVLDRTDLPKEVKGWLDGYVRKNDMVNGNNSYFTVYVSEYRQYKAEGDIDGYFEDYGVDMSMFMEWLEKQTSADEVLVLYWW